MSDGMVVERMDLDRVNLYLDFQGRNSNICPGLMEILTRNDGRVLWKNGWKIVPEARNSLGKKAWVWNECRNGGFGKRL